MDTATLVLLEMILIIGLCLGFGFYQLWTLHREKRRAAAAKQPGGPETP